MNKEEFIRLKSKYDKLQAEMYRCILNLTGPFVEQDTIGIGTLVTNSGKLDTAIIKGRIIGIMTPSMAVDRRMLPTCLYEDNTEWDKASPDWRSKPLYIVLLDCATEVNCIPGLKTEIQMFIHDDLRKMDFKL